MPTRLDNPIMDTLRSAKERGMVEEVAWQRWDEAFVCKPEDEAKFKDFWRRLGTEEETNGYRT